MMDFHGLNFKFVREFAYKIIYKTINIEEKNYHMFQPNKYTSQYVQYLDPTVGRILQIAHPKFLKISLQVISKNYLHTII